MTIIPKSQISSELSDNRVLRRYLDLPKFIDLLRTQNLFLCRADLFQDKFEGSFTPSLRAAIEEAYSYNKSEFSYEKFKKELREGVYVNCWSLGVNDNMALWELYGKSDASVAITTTVGRLRKELAASNLLGVTSLCKVEYIKHWNDPKIDIIPYSNVFRYKVVAYDFEREVRIIHDRFEQNFKMSGKESGLPLSVRLNSLLRSIVVSPSAQPWFIDLVKDVAQRYGVTTPVRRSKLSLDPI
ncbi:hypothetical protein [Ferribacterium limneticum]|uniref:hypothetical protein n=1 Tax=Ferribacterium limneticum TaxID=76259 RepID=UPI001CFB047D|nr:hypothetical protein [Ferribacterium limneticum]UCV28689.1 hypothetical protein KI617_00800 [Ferribacterium limneticum]UCV32606.1 hypothetical protein KI608_00800 [Ferribacterium limneticum]